MKLGTKIGFGFGIIILISAILGAVGWYGVNQVRSYMDEYALWGDIDMVMNEGVTQNSLMLMNDLNVYRSEPTEENLKTLKESLDEADKGIEEWHTIVKGYRNLAEVAQNTKQHLSTTRGVIENFSKSLKATAQIQKEWDQLVESCLAHLETTMEEVIDPAKERAEKSENITEMVKWSAIDMVMNEGVIANVLKLQTAAHDYASHSSEANWSNFLAARKNAKEGLKEWRGVLSSEERMVQAAEKSEEYLKTYEKLGNEYQIEVTKMQKLESRTGHAFKNLFLALENAMEKVIDPAKEAKVSAASSAQQRAANLAIIFTTSCVFIGILLAILITLGITRPINKIIASLNDGTAQVESASSQVARASQALAEGSSEQAASIEETSSSLEEMSSMTKQNAGNANQADNLMKEANRVVGEANESMTELTTSMEDISRASEETSKIIKTIDEIAFQTNLLALNAAVEAARAGEAGAGFAVVADEVRNLAMRAADAAKNTAELIEGTVKKVKDGSELVARTNEAFSGVSENTVKVGELVAEIAAASDEQATGIEQVNTAVTQMDSVVQANAANAEESASASEELNAQCSETYRIVQNLKALVNGAKGEDHAEGQEGERHLHVLKDHLGTDSNETSKNKAPSQDKTSEVSPEQVIPMDDNDFKDF
jgi:methyl-accepting chemotaxis protein